MSKLTVHAASEIPFYQGPNEIPGIRFRSARAALGVSAWGMNVLDLAANCDGYPEHNHEHDGQEEVYVVLEGKVDLHAGGEVITLSQGSMVRVPPEVTRKLVTTDSAVRVLAIGSAPGVAYQAPEGM